MRKRQRGSIPACAGNRMPAPGRPSASRSIPACAGEPGHGRAPNRVERVYPRVRGGTFSSAAILFAIYGLSPRARGNHTAAYLYGKGIRSIPACAGEPWRRMITLRSSKVYPRVRGGTAELGDPYLYLQGLSPRARGNRGRMEGAQGCIRSIPACAGEPGDDKAAKKLLTVYPRVRGGTLRLSVRWFPIPGLSPRARGNLITHQWSHKPNRSIPACAGEPSISIRQCNNIQVYPRVRGGTRDKSPRSRCRYGLSPRARGNP